MSEVNVQLKEGAQAVQLPAGVSVGEALKRLDRDAAKQALAAKVDGREVDLAFKLESADPVDIGNPVVPTHYTIAPVIAKIDMIFTVVVRDAHSAWVASPALTNNTGGPSPNSS